MKIKRFSRSIVAFMLLLCISIQSFTGASINVYAQGDDYTVDNKTKDFLISVYNAKDLSYDIVELLYSVDLYDENNDVIAQASLFQRDSQVDYVVYNYITDSIDEYGFDCPSAIDNFPLDSKTYYAGIYNYYNEVNGKIVNNVSGEVIDRYYLHLIVNGFREKLYERWRLRGKSSKADSGYDGIIYWKEIKENRTSGWENSAWGYLKGITWGLTTNTTGISGEGLSFSSMSSLSKGGTITNHCGPTALTNIMVYYKWLGMDTLLNDSRQDTFDRLRVMCKHDKNNTTYMNDARSALKNYMSERGYSVSMTDFNNDFSKYKAAIDANKIVLSLLNVKETDGDDWGHFVVTLGYEEFRQAYEKQVMWWTVTDYNYLRYIRVCDGWSSCDENRYVDLNNFFDSYSNSAVTIN